MNPPRSPATIEEVAAAAGVSRSTVSRVVNGSTAVSSTALEAVRSAIERLNYVPNRAARSLARRQTHAIALVVPEDTTRFFGDPFFASIVAGINTRLRSTDYLLNLFIASNEDGDKATDYLGGGNVDGAIIVSHHARDTFVERIARVLPVVFGGRPSHPSRTGDEYYVDVDNVAGAVQATEHLIARGRTRIVSISGPLDMAVGVDRIAGFQSALAAAGLGEGRVAGGDFTRVGGAAAMRELLDQGEPIDGVFAASDLMAEGALSVLVERGLSVPGDVSVVGFDDSSVATTVTPQLTTIAQPSFRQGELIADTLLRVLDGQDPERAVIVGTELVVRDSA